MANNIGLLAPLDRRCTKQKTKRFPAGLKAEAAPSRPTSKWTPESVLHNKAVEVQHLTLACNARGSAISYSTHDHPQADFFFARLCKIWAKLQDRK